MANYVENIKVANGETWPIRDAEAHVAIESAKAYATDYTDKAIEEATESTKEYAENYVDNAIANIPGKWELLWSNPEPLVSMPDSTFATDIGLSNYTICLIVCRHSTSMGYESSCLIHTIGMYSGTVYFPKAIFQGNTITESARYFTVSTTNNTVSCSNGYLSGNQNASACIPVHIYGARA